MIPVTAVAEVGLLGLVCDLSFETTGWIYLVYCPVDRADVMRLSRFTIRDDKLDPDSEKRLLQYTIDGPVSTHIGGGLAMDHHGNLHMGTGDNCFPIPELPVDHRDGGRVADAMRSSANSQDFRGKVLRIHPEPDGTYTIPDGNLFSEAKDGLREIYAMGCRNPFRVTVDEETGVVYWGDVGPNIQVDLELGPNGYDEFNRAPAAGNFGWPLFVGPNEAYRYFDFETRTAGKRFDVNHPVNDSPNNNGLRELPQPVPAFIWYPSGEFDRFPTMGVGARSAMVGPICRSANLHDAPLRLHDRFHDRLFIFEWARNWIQSVTIRADGTIADIEPFMPATLFRKPIDMEFGSDGALYIIEYGDKWDDNTDSELVRIVYRRGNRVPRSIVSTEPSAGRHPLTVQLDGRRSTDRDDDPLHYSWALDGRPLDVSAVTGEVTIEKPGRHEVSLTVTDSSGAASTAISEVRVGNAPPKVTVVSPIHGSFVDWGDTVRYELEVADPEDGSTRDGDISGRRVLLNQEHRLRRRTAGRDGQSAADDLVHPGLGLMRKTTCFACHTAAAKSAGPPYRNVALKYKSDSAARERLAQKIITGGAGVWGAKPMPPHPQHTVDQTRRMVDWVLSLTHDDSGAPIAGLRGFFRMPRNSRGPDSGVMVLTAEYTDDGVNEIPGVLPLRAESDCVLHLRRKRAALSDQRHGAELVDVFERGVGLVMQFAPGDWIAFEDVRLSDIDRVTWNAAAVAESHGALSLRIDAPDGPELARIEVTGESDVLGDVYVQTTTPIQDPGGLHDVYVVADGPRHQRVAAGKPLRLAWLEFLATPEAAQRKLAAKEATRRIVLVPTKPDHAFGTHMYTEVCEILAACLNRNPNIEAEVSTNLDWPSDEQLLNDADAVVYYSRPAGDVVLSPEHRAKFEELLQRKVGFTAIHWATAADEANGPRYEEILGGWFNFAFSGLAVDKRPLQQLTPNHPVMQGWKGYDLRDEFYLNLKFHLDAQPLLSVNVNDNDQTVAWVHERTDGGRSFGTTLGHFHENYSIPEFRRMLVNGILWTAGIDVPAGGAVVDVDPELLELQEPPQRIVKEWTFDDLLPLAGKATESPEFAAGERLFDRTGCRSCHKIGSEGETRKPGPNLSDVSVRMARDARPRAALLKAILQPSHRIEDKYRNTVILLATGQVVSGLVIAEDDEVVQVVANPAEPENVLQIPVDDIDDRQSSDVSLMPVGLFNTLTKPEIAHLLDYLESGGRADHVMYSKDSPLGE